MFLGISIDILFLIIHFANSNDKCKYKSCNVGKPHLLNVHIIPHTHNVVGYLKTVDQYYDGIEYNQPIFGVRYILDSIVASLLKDKRRKFSYVEMAYFYMWWNEQSVKVKNDVKMLVNEGRLQFISGGWTMNDEATTHYTAIIDQMSLGLDFLNQTFGKCGLPLVGWQIDSFGHSIEQANLFAEFGFDGWFFTRLHYSDLKQRRSTKKMEFIQRTSYFNAKNSKTLFTSILYDTYREPYGLCFDEMCTFVSIVDNPESSEYNINQISKKLMSVIEEFSGSYSTNHILIPIGGDFQYQNALQNFLNMDKLIKYTNAKYEKFANVFYSSPSCYLYAVNQLNSTFTVNDYDFFPYATASDQYWTGYYTSRPTIKGFVRKSNNIFQICKKIYALSGLNNRKLNELVKEMAIEMAIMQHHNAITGSHKQKVMKDYSKRLTKGIGGCEIVITKSLNKLLSSKHINFEFKFCNLLNISICNYTEQLHYKDQISIILFNPLAYSVKKWIRLPVVISNSSSFNILDSNNNEVDFEQIPIQNHTLKIPERFHFSKANYELVLETLVPGMGYSFYKIARINKRKQLVKPLKDKDKMDYIIVENSKLKLQYFDGLLIRIWNKVSNISLKVTQTIRTYKSPYHFSKAGIHVFHPEIIHPINETDDPQIKFYNGNLVQEIHQKFNDYASLVTRLYRNADLIETEWTIGPLPKNKNNDVIMYFNFELNNNGTFYTDSNGRQLIKRQIKEQNLRSDEYNFAKNYYPIVSNAILFDSNIDVAFSLHTDRAQGGGAINSGEFEVMVHRRIFTDDGSGVEEYLDELGSNDEGLIVKGRHWFTIDSVKNIFERRRNDALNIFNEPEILFSKLSQYLKADNLKLSDYSGINMNAIPKGLHILSFENHITNNNEVDYKILRLENILHTNTPPIKVHIESIFKNFKILRYEELNLSTNQLLKNVVRLKWNYKNKNEINETQLEEKEGIIFVKPNQIRTFKIFT